MNKLQFDQGCQFSEASKSRHEKTNGQNQGEHHGESAPACQTRRSPREEIRRQNLATGSRTSSRLVMGTKSAHGRGVWELPCAQTDRSEDLSQWAAR